MNGNESIHDVNKSKGLGDGVVKLTSQSLGFSLRYAPFRSDVLVVVSGALFVSVISILLARDMSMGQ